MHAPPETCRPLLRQLSRTAGVFASTAVAAAALATAALAQAPAPTALPAPRLDGTVAIERTLAQRRSLRSFGERALSLAETAQLLWAAQGVSDSGRGRRTAPSAGATYPLVLYLVAGRVDALVPGVYRYEPTSHHLTPVRAGDARAGLVSAARGQAWLREAPAWIVVAAQPARTATRYGSRSDRFVALEAGAAAQNLLLQAVALGLGGTIVGAFDETALRDGLPLAEGEQPLAVVAVGPAR